MSGSENNHHSKKLTLHTFKSFGVDDRDSPRDDGKRIAMRQISENKTSYDNSKYAMVRTDMETSHQLMVIDVISFSEKAARTAGYSENEYEVVGKIDDYRSDVFGYASTNNYFQLPALTLEEAHQTAETWFENPKAIRQRKKAYQDERKQNLLKKIISSTGPS